MGQGQSGGVIAWFLHVNEPAPEKRFAEHDEKNSPRARRIEAAALGWPVLWALVTVTLFVLHALGWRLPGRALGQLAAWTPLINAFVAVFGSVAAGVYANRYHQRVAAAVVFGIASLLIHITVLAIVCFFIEIAGFHI